MIPADKHIFQHLHPRFVPSRNGIYSHGNDSLFLAGFLLNHYCFIAASLLNPATSLQEGSRKVVRDHLSVSRKSGPESWRIFQHLHPRFVPSRNGIYSKMFRVPRTMEDGRQWKEELKERICHHLPHPLTLLFFLFTF